jgi:hypothetical protein
MITEVKPKGYGIASMVLGILSIIFCWVPILSTVMGILAIVFYNVQKKVANNGMAIAGLVTGIIGTVLSILYLFVWITLLGALSSL